MLEGCTSTPNRAPVEDRAAASRSAARASEATKAASGNSASGSSAAVAADAKAGSYTVKPGDTLMRIALENGQSWRDIVRWNNIENPNLIEPGMVLRVTPPASDTVANTRPVAPARVDAKPLDGKAASAPATTGVAAPAAVSASAVPAASAPTVMRESDDDIQWSWPAAGPVVSAFDDNRTKGLGIGGKAGDPVLAAADGRVVYAGSGLRGYGNLVIIKHNATYLTAYAHNQALLVKEDQVVRKGQKIAEMGSSDADKVQLHFEIRKQGKPMDPAKMLPSR
jgi:lipoprotein NlpD